MSDNHIKFVERKKQRKKKYKEYREKAKETNTKKKLNTTVFFTRVYACYSIKRQRYHAPRKKQIRQANRVCCLKCI